MAILDPKAFDKPQTLDLYLNDAETTLPAGRFETSSVVNVPVNLRGVGRRLSRIVGATFNYHGEEDYRKEPGEKGWGHLVEPLIVSNVAFYECSFNWRFVIGGIFRDCLFHNCSLRAFSLWDFRSRDNIYTQSTWKLQDGIGSMGGNRGFCNAWTSIGDTFEVIDDDAIYWGAYSAVCKVGFAKFDRVKGKPVRMNRLAVATGPRANIVDNRTNSYVWVEGEKPPVSRDKEE